MFNKLVASEGKRRGLFGAKTMTVSLTVHGLLLVGAVYATVLTPAEAKEVEEEVTFVEIEEKQPEAPKAAEPPPPPPPEQSAAPPPPKGFQELLPPDQPPPVIPDVDTSQPAVVAEDFSGVGVAGGTAHGVEGGTPQNAAVTDSVFEVGALDYDSRPELSNRNQVGSILARFYPRMLQDAGIEGQVMVQFVITSAGKVDPATVKVVQASNEQFAEATQKAVERFRFRPGKYQGHPVPVLIQIPITWKVQ